MRGGRRTTRVSKHYAVMCSAICGVNVCIRVRTRKVEHILDARVDGIYA